MIDGWKTSVWKQFGAAIDMLDDAVRACPDELWRERLWDDPSDRPEYCEFWFLVYHTLYWLDLYLNGTAEGFAPPALFQRYEKDVDGILPKTPYTKDDLLTYLEDCRRKCQATIEALTEETALELCQFRWVEGGLSFLELQLYNMRHVQEHASQLSLLLGQRGGSETDWVTRARSAAA